MQYYLDTCIWLNLIKKEGDASKGVPYYEIAEKFIDKVISSGDKVIYSGFVLKELKHQLYRHLYEENHELLKKGEGFQMVKSKSEDYVLARKLELEFNFKISFFDCLHTAIAYRLDCILITRDKLLIKAAKKYVKVCKPEDLFS